MNDLVTPVISRRNRASRKNRVIVKQEEEEEEQVIQQQQIIQIQPQQQQQYQEDEIQIVEEESYLQMEILKSPEPVMTLVDDPMIISPEPSLRSPLREITNQLQSSSEIASNNNSKRRRRNKRRVIIPMIIDEEEEEMYLKQQQERMKQESMKREEEETVEVIEVDEEDDCIPPKKEEEEYSDDDNDSAEDSEDEQFEEVIEVEDDIDCDLTLNIPDENEFMYCVEIDKYIFMNSDKKMNLVKKEDDNNKFLIRKEDWEQQYKNSLLVSNATYSKLFPHQKQGIRWLYERHLNRISSILADDMGLGKTCQVVTALNGIYGKTSDLYRVIIVCPKSCMENWRREIIAWGPDLTEPVIFHGQSSRKRIFKDFNEEGGIIITTYHLVHQITAMINRVDKPKSILDVSITRDYSFKIDYVVMDEAHVLKAPKTKIFAAMTDLKPRVKQRVLLTGTPIQNNLKELYSLFTFVDDKILGTPHSYSIHFAGAITRGSKKGAKALHKILALERAQELRNIVDPFVLRREKSELRRLRLLNARKNDIITWIYLKEEQIEEYKEIVDSRVVRDILDRNEEIQAGFRDGGDTGLRGLAIKSMTQLRLLCNHPYCLFRDGLENAKLEESGKLMVLRKLVEQFKQEGHRCLIFSQFTSVLDLIEHFVLEDNTSYLRIDGSVSSMHERQRRMDLFNENDTYTCFLITSQCGGYGLNLTGADRVIIMEPSYNPSLDSQAVDRCYRISQNKDVLVYRLVTCNSIEEKIYRMQIFKNGLGNRIMKKDENDDNQKKNNADQYRYFSNNQLREMLTFDERMVRECKTYEVFQEAHGDEKNTYPKLDAHLEELQNDDEYKELIFGISHNDILYSKQGQDLYDDPEPEPQEPTDPETTLTQNLLAEAAIAASFLQPQIDADSIPKPTCRYQPYPQMSKKEDTSSCADADLSNVPGVPPELFQNMKETLMKMFSQL
jgi:SNF2 family DNA or RNA helicase